MKKRLLKLLKTTVKLAMIVGLAIGGWYAYQYYVPQEEEDGLGELPTAIAEVRDITVSVQATGVLQPIKIVEIKSKASGEILDMPVEMGDYVEAGALIAQIDTNILDQELRQVQADYDSSVIRLNISRNQYERAQSLFAEDLISEDALENSQQTFTNAQGQLLRAEATLDLAKERLADATVRAPSPGTIINKTVEEGQIIASSTNNVSGGTTLVQMADLSQMEIRTLVDEVDIGQVRGGQDVESKVEAFPDEAFAGTVIKIEPQATVQQSVTTFPVLSRIDNRSGKLLPGMNADVEIIIYRKPRVLTIPNEAVRTPQDGARVSAMLGVIASEDDPTSPGNEGRGGNDRGVDGQGRGSGGDRGGVDGEGRGTGGDRGDARSGDRGSQNGSSPQGSSRDQGQSAERGGTGDRGQSGGRGGSDDGGDTGGAGDHGTPQRGDSGGSGGADRGGSGGAGGEDMRARFQNASPADRERLIAEMRAAREAEDRDVFGIEGRREDAVVFVYDETGILTTRNIVVGARDWEGTEILAGLDVGDEVLMLPSTSLLESQDRLRNWAQGRSGIPGMGGGMSGRGRGGPPPGMGRGGGPGR